MGICISYLCNTEKNNTIQNNYYIHLNMLGIDTATSKTDPSKMFALKTFQKRNSIGFNTELQILKSLKSPYIVELIDVQNDENNDYLILEYLTGGDLLDNLLDTKNGFSEDKTK